MAKLYFRYGVMSSGKTLDLMKTYYNYKEKGMNALIIKPLIDSKGDNYIVSRNGSKLKVDYKVSSEDNIYTLISNEIVKTNIDAVLVDEAQFLSEKQVDELTDIVDYLNIPVIAYGLRIDFKDNFFTGSKRLFEVADTLEEMKTICECGKKATEILRFNNGEAVLDGEQVAIDGKDNISYASVCRKCKKDYKRKLVK